MRCLALADAWHRRGGEAHLLSRAIPPALIERVANSGARLTMLDPEASPSQEVEQVVAVGRRESPGWIVLDGYHFSTDYQTALRASGRPVAAIDDGGHLPAYDADLILNQNLQASEIVYRSRADARFLLGPRFCLLRPELREWRQRRRRTPAVAQRLLVTLGAGDAAESLRVVLAALEQLGEPIHARVLIGGAEAARPWLTAAAARVPGQVELLPLTPGVAPLMAWAHMAISAAGTTAWELACLGVPMLLLPVAENQIETAERLARRGAALSLGPADRQRPNDLAREIDALARDPGRRATLTRRARRVVDGRGADRVCDALLERA